MSLPRFTSVCLTARDGRRLVVKGRTHRGLALTAPVDLTGPEPVFLAQDRHRPAWTVHHLQSGLALGCVWGRITEAWPEFKRLAEAADWDRPSEHVLVDPTCQVLHEKMRRAWREEVSR